MLNTEIMKSFFKQILLLQKKYKIFDCKIYNMNKKGFQINQTVSDYIIFNKYSDSSVTLSTDII